MPKQRSWTEEQLRLAVVEAFSTRDCLRRINLRPTGGNYKQIHKYIKEYQLDTSHWTGQAWNKGKNVTCNPPRPLSEILVKDSTYTSSHLRLRLIKEEIFEKKCYRCNLTEWLSNPISLELEHINGINTDNRLENLTLLCPNCHALTTTYRGRNIGIQAGVAQSVGGKALKTPTVSVRIRPPVLCLDCNKSINSKSTRCKSCAAKHQAAKIQWPSAQSLIDAIVNGNSYSQLGKQLGVSDNAIRKYILSKGLILPRKHTNI